MLEARKMNDLEIVAIRQRASETRAKVQVSCHGEKIPDPAIGFNSIINLIQM
jgi:hypothetical protein